jgi:tetratricopeptide (TPR) repeat protein
MYVPPAAVVTGIAVGGFLADRWLVDGGAICSFAYRFLATCLVICATAALGMFTVHRNFDYQSDLTIWQDTVAKVPHNPRAHYNLGVTLAGRGQVEEAIAQYQKALEIKPDYAAARRNLDSIRASRK